MPQYNSSFDMTIEDIDLIETALREHQRDLSSRRARQSVESALVAETDGVDELEANLEATADLLGRIHNQKVFYRPKKEAYIGG
ncbi:MAG: hypothetical protein AAGA12_03405 [Pseudomonadota bacterium]